jgi:hypothetical protein
MSFGLSPDSCAASAIAITKADSDLGHPVRSLYIGGAGNVRVTTVNNHDVTFVGVLAGTILPVSVKRVWSTNTTATSIVGLS